MYIANTYIGGKYVPGEIIPDDTPVEALDWLIRSGAVRKAAPEPSDEPQAAPAEAPAVAVEEAADEAPEDDFDDAPEIDAMAGIVKEPPKARSRKKGGKAS